MRFRGLDLSLGIRKTHGSSGTSSRAALAQVAHFQKGYMWSGKEVYFCDDYIMVCLTCKNQFRICIPASEAIAGQLGEGVEEILSMKGTGECRR